MFKEFKAFILRGNVVDLAVAVVIGAAFGAVVTSFTNNILMPIIGIIGSKDFAEFDFTIRGSVFRYGLFINSLISFVLIAAAIFFFVVKPLNVLAARRARGAPPESPTTKACPECLSDIPIAATRCAYCTTEVPAAA